MAAALLVTLPVVVDVDQEVPAHGATPAAAEASLLPRPAHLLAAGPVLQQPARVAPVAAPAAPVAEAPDSRQAVRASRSLIRKASPVRKMRNTRKVRAVRVVAKRVEVRHARPVHRIVHRAPARRARPAAGLAAVAAFARRQVGKPYIYGSDGPRGYDCSGLVKASYAQIGVRMPHQSGAQAARAYRIPRSQARPGDLVVGAGHVGVYMGNGMMVDAPGRGRRILYRHLFGGLHIERVR